MYKRQKIYGDDYYNFRQFKTKSKGAQEAHEAIRPTYMENDTINSSSQEKRLYDLIWKRTVASQMSDAQIEKTTITINISGKNEQFVATGEVVKFDGFLKVYKESSDEESEDDVKMLPPVKPAQKLEMKNIQAAERFTHYPARYTEASLVKKLEELGIGRPSTYAPTISTIQHRGYVVREDRKGTDRNYQMILLEEGHIKEEVKTETTGNEKAKLFPTDIGMVVTDYLLERFSNILDFNFTASVEEEFDEIAEGKVNWGKMLDSFYKDFHKQVEKAEETKERNLGERQLGNDPVSGKPVLVKIGRFGPMVQMGETTETEKPRFARLQKGQHIENITLAEAMNLFRLPRKIGLFEDSEISVGIGRFGPYLNHNSKFYSLGKEDDPYTVDLARGIEVINAKREQEKNRIIRQFDNEKELFVLNGRFGPYVSFKKENYKIPKGKEPKDLTYEDCMELIKQSDLEGRPRRSRGRFGKKEKTATPAPAKAAPKAKKAAKAKAPATKKATKKSTKKK